MKTLLFAALAAVGAGADEPPTLRIGESRIEMLVSGTPSVSQAELREWVHDAARAVTTYYGRFPVPRVRLKVRAGGRGRVRSGVTYGGELPTIRITVGEATTRADLDKDWILTHEMVHLAFPDLDSDYSWLGEGLATYIEPIARARIGKLDETEVWQGLVEGLPQGLPGPNDGGLDGTRAWGRKYWGGALFCLLTDVKIREKTDGRRGLEDALRSVLTSGGDVRLRWPLDLTLKTGDEATGASVLVPLHLRFGERPVRIDLASLWKKLGVLQQDGEIAFDDAAPAAATRRALTRRDSSAGGVELEWNFAPPLAGLVGR